MFTLIDKYKLFPHLGFVKSYMTSRGIISIRKIYNKHGGFYRLHSRDGQQNLGKVITINGLEEWGHGYSWNKAESLVKNRITKLYSLYNQFDI